MKKNIQNLRAYNTFRINATCSHFIEITQASELTKLPDDLLRQAFILGGGSNILFIDDIFFPILKINIKGLETLEDASTHIRIKAGAGENWSDFVDYCTDNNWYGVENMALIPGTVGASPIQNIGAYGREVRDVIHTVHYFHKEKKEPGCLSNADCRFGYRDSIFKNDLKNKVIITAVEFTLSKSPELHLDYGPLKKLKSSHGTTPKMVAEEVKAIRRSKLPDPDQTGNGGSFFKNPFITQNAFLELKNNHPDIPHFEQEGKVKIPAAWLIEQAGWKGYRFNDYGVHEHQALVLVNHGNASGRDIFLLSERIIQSVYDHFNIRLEREINIVPDLVVQ